MTITLEEVHTISVGDTERVSIDYTDHLDSGESLTGTPTVAEVTTTALTLGSKAVNTTTYVDAVSEATVAVGKAVQFTVTGGAAGTEYRIRVTVSTTSSRTFVRDILLGFE